MKKLFSAFFALSLFVSFAADAGWNLRQKDDGTAEWVQSDGDTHPIGSVYLNIQITDVNTATTWTVISPVTDANIALVQAVLQDYVAGTATFSIYTSDTTTPTLIGDEVTNGTAALALDTANELQTFTPTAENTVQKGQIIYISNDGSATSSAGGGITIVLERN